ncbi:MAG: DUF72 domain-containing protein [Gemmatimonas sp.]
MSDLFETDSWRDESARIAPLLPPNLYLGTSSWNYSGWYPHVFAKKYPKTGAVTKQLAEYASHRLFRSVGVDSFFYRPPSPETLQEYARVLPDDFRAVMKVWDRITSFALAGPRHAKTTEPNHDFLNAALFQSAVLDPALEHFAQHAGPFVFEFESIPAYAKIGASEFASRLDAFFRQLPRGPRYAVEIRNKAYLHPDYFAALREHNVAHVFSSWARMPSIGEQLTAHDSLTADFIISRALTAPGLSYKDSVDKFEPYDRLQEEQPEVRRDLQALIEKGLTYQRAVFIIANNRLEGSSPHTLLAIAKHFIGYRTVDG